MKIIITMLALLLSISVQAQLINQGAGIVISEATLIVEGDIYNNENSFIHNQGSIVTKGSLHNHSNATLSGDETGNYLIHQNLENEGDLQQVSCRLEGSFDSQLNAGGATLVDLGIAKTNGATVTLTGYPLTVEQSIDFGLGSNRLLLAQQSLHLAPEADIFGYDADNYIVTPAEGLLIKEQLNGVFYFPIGSAETYRPALINSVETQTLGMRSISHEAPYLETPSMDFAWEIYSESAEFMPATIDVFWKMEDEPEGYERQQTRLFQQQSDTWDAQHTSLDLQSKAQFSATASIAQAGVYTLGNTGEAEPDIELTEQLQQPDDKPTGQSVRIFPNPSTDGFNIVFSENVFDPAPVELEMYDVLGRRTMQHNIELPLEGVYWLTYPSHVSSGMYFLKIRQGNQLKAEERIIVQRKD